MTTKKKKIITTTKDTILTLAAILTVFSLLIGGAIGVTIGEGLPRDNFEQRMVDNLNNRDDTIDEQRKQIRELERSNKFYKNDHGECVGARNEYFADLRECTEELEALNE